MKQRQLRIAHDASYAYSLPEGHRFPMIKYELIPGQLLYEGTITQENLFHPEPCADEHVFRAHTNEYVEKLKSQTLSAKEQRAIGFPQSPQLTEREWRITQGTIECCHHALEHGISLNVAGGTHHAYSDRGEGFCLLNDFAVAAHYLLAKKLSGQILIIDLDVHQGNGTAKIFEHENRVFTFSMHGEHNYPFRKEKSDLDIGLRNGTGDSLYLSILESNLKNLLHQVKPDFAFFLSGVDILETDQFGKLQVTLNGCQKRDEIVFTMLEHAGIPCTVAMGGGYSADVKIITEAHCNTFRTAKEIYHAA